MYAVLTTLVLLSPPGAGGWLVPEAPLPAPEPAEYRVDPNHAHVGFAVRHLGLSKVRGAFGTVSGVLRYDPESLEASSVEVVIDASSLDTGNERRDRDVGENFLEVAEHPEIRFRSTDVTRSPQGLEVTGVLTLHGISKEVSFPFEIRGPVPGRGDVELVAVEGTLSIDRRDFGITVHRVLETGAIVVGNEVEIELAVEFGRRTGEGDGSPGG